MGDMTATRALAYDCVYNGVEVGGGSLRIHRSDMQAKVFEIIGLDAGEATDKFGWLLDALDMGAPPHGGMAFGVDRLIMLIAGAKSIRCAADSAPLSQWAGRWVEVQPSFPRLRPFSFRVQRRYRLPQDGNRHVPLDGGTRTSSRATARRAAPQAQRRVRCG